MDSIAVGRTLREMALEAVQAERRAEDERRRVAYRENADFLFRMALDALGRLLNRAVSDDDALHIIIKNAESDITSQPERCTMRVSCLGERFTCVFESGMWSLYHHVQCATCATMRTSPKPVHSLADLGRWLEEAEICCSGNGQEGTV